MARNTTQTSATAGSTATKASTSGRAPAKATGRPAKRVPLDLATTEQADGALPSFRSAYELVGIRDVTYRHRSFAEYQKWLAASDLVELHDHAYAIAVVCSSSRPVMIQRLEDKYLNENPHERVALAEARQAAARENVETTEQAAERIMARGR